MGNYQSLINKNNNDTNRIQQQSDQHYYYYYQQDAHVVFGHDPKEQERALEEMQNASQLEALLWIKEFRPVLQLLWPHLDFSDDLVTRWKFEIMNHEVRFVYTDTDFNMEEYNRGPFALIAFLYSRGVNDMAGLSIFRKIDILEANNSMYGGINNSDSQFLEKLEAICIYLMIRNQVEGLEAHVNKKTNEEEMCCNGLCEIRLRAKEMMRHWRFSCNESAEEILTATRAAEMIKKKSLFSNDDNGLDEKEVELQATEWALDGYIWVLSFLSKELSTAPTHSRGNLLQKVHTLRMSIPLNLILFSSAAQAWLTNLIRSGRVFHVDCHPLDFVFYFDKYPARSNFSFLDDYPRSYAVACRAISEGWGLAVGQYDWRGAITIKGIDLTCSDVVQSLSEKNNLFNELFKRDDVHKLHVTVKHEEKEEQEYDDPFSDSKMKPPFRFGECHLQCLNLHNLIIGSEGWIALWDRVKMLQNLECLAIDPNGGTGLDIGCLSAAINAACSLPRLMVLDLQPHGLSGMENCVDLTGAFVSLLDMGLVRDINVDGYRTETGVLGYKIDAEKLCQTMERNASLKSIVLSNVYLLETSLTKNEYTELETLTQQLILMMHRSKTANLSRIQMCGNDYIYAGTGVCSFIQDHGFPPAPYKCYKDALYLEYLTNMNHFGIGQIQDKSSTTKDLVLALYKVRCCFYDDEVSQRILRLANDLDNNDCSSEDCVTRLYEELRNSPSSWCRTPEEDVECVGVLYGLLRVRPDLWCNAHHSYDKNGRDDGTMELGERPNKRPRCDNYHSCGKDGEDEGTMETGEPPIIYNPMNPLFYFPHN